MAIKRSIYLKLYRFLSLFFVLFSFLFSSCDSRDDVLKDIAFLCTPLTERAKAKPLFSN